MAGRTRKGMKFKQVKGFSGVEEIFKEDCLAIYRKSSNKRPGRLLNFRGSRGGGGGV